MPDTGLSQIEAYERQSEEIHNIRKPFAISTRLLRTLDGCTELEIVLMLVNVSAEVQQPPFRPDIVA